jgi:hypothetical protein
MTEKQLHRLALIDDEIERIAETMRKPNWRPQTSLQMETRAYSLASMGTGIKLHGGKVQRHYR